MGKATVTGGGAAGLYSVQLDLGAARKAAAVAKFNKLIADLGDRIGRQQLRLDEEEALEDARRVDLDMAIAAYADAAAVDPAGEAAKAASDVVLKASEALAEQVTKTADVRVPLQMMRAERVSAQKRLQELQAIEVQRAESVWCVDLTENAVGEVATIEVPGEPQQLLIAPGGRAPATGDGFLLARGLMSPEQAFYNAALLPGWQKFKPMYRTGTLTAVDAEADTASVQLDAAQSSAQDLPVNQAVTLTSVPVVYMTCNARAFAPGDRVVVAFEGQSWTSPRVIGFVDHPKRCGWLIQYTCDAGGEISGEAAQIVQDGEDAAPISVVVTDPQRYFKQWSDGNTSASRHDLNITASADYHAQIAPIAGLFPSRLSMMAKQGFAFSRVSQMGKVLTVMDDYGEYAKLCTYPGDGDGPHVELRACRLTFEKALNFWPGGFASANFGVTGTGNVIYQAAYSASGNNISIESSYIQSISGYAANDPSMPTVFGIYEVNASLVDDPDTSPDRVFIGTSSHDFVSWMDYYALMRPLVPEYVTVTHLPTGFTQTYRHFVGQIGVPGFHTHGYTGANLTFIYDRVS